MRALERWESVGGPDLSGPGGERLPNEPAVYMWRRRPHPPPGTMERRASFLSWLRKEISLPYCLVTNRSITPYLHAERLTVGGHEITLSKSSALEELCDDRRFRFDLLKLVEFALDQGPALYVGKADNLRNRIAQHLRRENRLRESPRRPRT